MMLRAKIFLLWLLALAIPVQGSAAVLRVPSVLVPEEYNVVLNPAHPEHSRIRVMEVVPFRFDARLLAERGSGRSR